MLKLARVCIAHRRVVVGTWVLVAVVTTLIAHAVGNQYANNFTLPGTDSQRALNLLARDFPEQSGDIDTLVFHVSNGTIDSPAVRAALTPLLASVANFPHVAGVISPYSARGTLQVSRDRKTAFESINYDKRANLLPNDTGEPLLKLVKSVHVPGLE